MTEAIAGVSIHPYAKNVGGVKEQVEDTRKVMRKAGEQRAFIYIGEIGWASAGPKRSFLVKDREKQAKLLKKAYRFLLKRRQKWHIRGAFWYTWQDYPKDPNCNWCAKAGLFDKHGNAKPSGRAYKRLIGKNVG